MGKTTTKSKQKINNTIFSQIKKYWPIGVVLAIWILFIHPYLLFGRVPFPSDYLVDFFAPWNNYFGLPVKNNAMSDVINQLYPWKIITIDSWKAFQVPKWNPYQFAGTPHLANYQSAVFSPINLLFFVMPFIDAWSIQVLLQPLFAGLFMMVYLREIRLSKIAATLGSVAFMFGGYMTVWMAYATLGYALLFLPLILFAIERLEKNMSVKYMLLIAISVWFSLVSGHFQISFYVLLFSGAYFIYKALLGKDFRFFVYGLISLIIGLVVALPQLFASYELYNQSARSIAFGKGAAIPLKYLITLIAPDYFGNPVTRNDWYGLYAEFALFLGSFSLFFVLLSLFIRYRLKYVVFFVLAAVVSLLLSLDTIITDIVVELHIPFISTSYLSRTAAIVTFSLATLMAFGIDALISTWNKHSNTKIILMYSGIWLLVLGYLWIDLTVFDSFIIPKENLEAVVIAKRNLRLPTLIILSGIIVSCIGLFVRKTNKKVIMSILAGSLVVILLFDMYRYSTKWMPFDTREHVYPSLPLLEFLQDNAGYNRVSGNIVNESMVPFGLYGVEGYDPLYIARYGELLNFGGTGEFIPAERSVAQFPDTGLHAKKLMDLLGIKYFVHSVQDEQRSYVFPFWDYPDSFGKPVWADDTYEVYENTSAFDRAFVVTDYNVITSDHELLSMLYDSETDLSNTVLLEEDPQISSENCNGNDSSAEITRYTHNEVEILVNSSCSGLLVLTDSYYPDWKAYINSEEVDILRANYSFRAVPIEEGRSEIIFRI